jgi:hypothetical protein
VCTRSPQQTRHVVSDMESKWAQVMILCIGHIVVVDASGMAKPSSSEGEVESSTGKGGTRLSKGELSARTVEMTFPR